MKWHMQYLHHVHILMWTNINTFVYICLHKTPTHVWTQDKYHKYHKYHKYPHMCGYIFVYIQIFFVIFVLSTYWCRQIWTHLCIFAYIRHPHICGHKTNITNITNIHTYPHMCGYIFVYIQIFFVTFVLCRQISTHVCIFVICVWCIHTCVYICDTGWRRLIGSPKLQIILHKRATKCRSLLRKMTYKDKGSYESSPPCICLMYSHMCGYLWQTYLWMEWLRLVGSFKL